MTRTPTPQPTLDLPIPREPTLTEQRAVAPTNPTATTHTPADATESAPIGMRRIAGIDTSLTSTGVAIITQRVNGSTLANVTTITSRGKRADTLMDRAQRILTLTQQILHALAAPVLVVIEGPSLGSKGGSPLDRYGLWWHVAASLTTRDIPVAVCAPSTRAKFITGTGNADKASVAAGVSRLWPDVELPNSDTADALALAHCGATYLGWGVQTLKRHHDALSAIKWPFVSPVGSSEVSHEDPPTMDGGEER